MILFERGEITAGVRTKSRDLPSLSRETVLPGVRARLVKSPVSNPPFWTRLQRGRFRALRERTLCVVRKSG